MKYAKNDRQERVDMIEKGVGEISRGEKRLGKKIVRLSINDEIPKPAALS